MATSTQNSFQLIGVINGTSINGTLQVDNGPLLQVIKDSTSAATPNWEAMAENKRPVVYPALVDLASGNALSPNTVSYSYNGVKLTFGADGLSNNTGWAGVFKLVTGYSATVVGKTVTLTALRIMKNLAPFSGNDNDRISCSGTVERNGQSIGFNELSTTVVIQQSTGNAYYLWLTADNSALTGNVKSTKVHANVVKDGSPMTDLSGLSFKWKKRTATGDIDFATTQDVTVTVDDIDGSLTLLCTVSQGNTELATNQIQIFDFSDPDLMRFKGEGVTLPYIQQDQTAVITPYIVRGSTGEERKDITPTYTFYTRDNDGKDLLPSGQTKLPFTAANVRFSYEEVMGRGKGSVGGYVLATW